ncbi:formate dehydrogenase subunit alpha [Dehalococcoidia bacterium]|nr:formate dehydrogenase subunit alpha [Dehalococcoidia bacterium]
MSEVSLIIDGIKVRAREGSTVLEAAQDSGIYIPSLCTDPELEPYGGCRLCLVEIENVEGLPVSCMTLVAEGMVVRTDTSRVSEVRRRVLELLLCDHPDNCLPCPKNRHCELQKVAAYIGIDHLRFKKLERPPLIDTSNPFFIRDSSKCILCGKCVRVCKEVQGVAALEIANDGLSSRIITVGDTPILDSICESCGECVVRCPVGALVPKNLQKPSYEVKSICPYCGCGCGIYLGVRGSRIVSVRGDSKNPVNKGNLCVKGRFGYDFINHPERLTTPLIKRNRNFVEATWEEALDLVASKLANYKGDQFAVIASAKCTNEENYVIQKFARAVTATNNIDHCVRLCHASTLVGLSGVIGSGAMTNSIDEISDAACILAIGTNTTEAHPIIGLRVKKAKQNGAKLIVANPRQIDLCRFADIWLQQRPGSDVALLMGMARVIVDEGLVDAAFIEEFCENFDEFRKSLNSFDLDTVERITSVPKEKIIDAARIYATNKPASIITQHSHGTDNVFALANLAMLTGNIGKPSSGLNLLWGQNNTQGACDMGCLPIFYPGYQMVADQAIKKRFEAAWGVSLNPKPGLTLTEGWQAASHGRIKALYLIGVNPVLSAADTRQVREGLEAAEFVVVQDIFLTETAKFADVVLPAASFAEKDGTFTNTERRIQRVYKAIEPVGNSRPDWWIICEVARKLGSRGFDFSHPAEIMEEIASLHPSYKGISYDRLENGGLQWPCPSGEHPGTRILHIGQFCTASGRGKFTPLEYKPSAELPDDEYPLVLTCEYQYHTTLSRKVEGLNLLGSQELVEMNPQDAAQLGIGDGDMVRVISRRGEAKAKAKVTDGSPKGVICMTSYFPAVDPVFKIPELKVCGVRVEKALPLKNKGASQR